MSIALLRRLLELSRADPEVRDWLTYAVKLWRNGDVTLQDALGLDDVTIRSERNRAILDAALIIDPDGVMDAWSLAQCIADEMRRPLRGGELSEAIRRILKADKALPRPLRSTRRIYDVLIDRH